MSERVNERIRILHELLVGSRPITSYCDVGCGDGSITHQVAQSLDVEEYYMYDVIPVKDPHYTELTNIPDHSIDLVTCFVAIHHFQDPVAMFSQIMRILKPNGYLFIREHDVNDKNTAITLELMHRMFPDPDYACYFRSREALRNTLIGAGFELIRSYDYDPQFNPQHLYHEMYMLNHPSQALEFTTPFTVTDHEIVQWINQGNAKSATKLATKTGTKREYAEIMRYFSRFDANKLARLKTYLHSK